MQSIVKNNYSKIVKICQDHHVGRLFTFGSVNTSDFNENSDIDLIVELELDDPIEKGETLMVLWDKFEELFGRNIDLLSKTTVSNPYLQKGIDATKELVYES